MKKMKKTKIFISHSFKDNEFVEKLRSRLIESEVDVWVDKTNLKLGDNIVLKIDNALNEADYIIFVLSKNSVNSKWVQLELSTTLNNEISREQTFIIPIIIDDCDIPFELKNRFYADFRTSFDEPFNLLLKSIKDKKLSIEETLNREHVDTTTIEDQISKLQVAYQKGNLTLFCGAGISLDAGIPTWNLLLKALLNEAFKSKEIQGVETILADVFQNKNNLPPIIIGKYLKNILGNDFMESVRNVLYKNCTRKSLSIDEIVELCRPKRDTKPLKAIITYNFDDIIELKLQLNKIEYKSIYSEGERYSENELPIFHVHGFLPSKGKLSENSDIVFSEDAYHTQFIDPFSWSNLVQLNYLNTSTCLFVGISLTDPNMRRLIDVSKRKSGKDETNHYVIKRRYKVEDLTLDASRKTGVSLIKIIENIEEQDAKNLGINIIWISEFDEIPKILKQIDK